MEGGGQPAAGGRAVGGPSPTVLHHERLGPPLWWAVPVAGMAASVALALAAAVGPGAATVGATVTVLLAAVGSLVLSRAVLDVRTDGVRVDRAVLPLDVITGARALAADQATQLRGPGYDPRGWYRLRGWIPGAVQFTLADPVDPTTFWFVSSRAPELAVAAVARAVGALPPSDDGVSTTAIRRPPPFVDRPPPVVDRPPPVVDRPPPVVDRPPPVVDRLPPVAGRPAPPRATTASSGGAAPDQ